MAYNKGETRNVRVRAPKVSSYYASFDGGFSSGYIVDELDLSSLTSTSNSSTLAAHAIEIHNLKLSSIAMTGANPVYSTTTSTNRSLYRITMAPDATEDNVPSSWKIGLKYTSYEALEEFIASLPVTSTTKALTIIHIPTATCGAAPLHIRELAVSKGYTLAFAAS